MKPGSFAFVSLCLALPATLPGAEAPGPPKLLEIIREQVKAGKAVAHEKIEAGWPAAYARSRWPIQYLGMTSVTGPSQALFMVPFASWAAFEKDTEGSGKNAVLDAELKRLGAQDADAVASSETMLVSYREDLSYRADLSVATMRYFSITTIHLNPGHEQDFVALRKLVNEGHDKAKIDEHWAAYQVISGAPSGTFLIVLPMKSLADLDSARETHGKPFQDALGEANQARHRELTEAAIRSSDNAIFAFAPRMSYVSKEFAAGDPDFWTPKPAAPKP